MIGDQIAQQGCVGYLDDGQRVLQGIRKAGRPLSPNLLRFKEAIDSLNRSSECLSPESTPVTSICSQSIGTLSALKMVLTDSATSVPMPSPGIRVVVYFPPNFVGLKISDWTVASAWMVAYASHSEFDMVFRAGVERHLWSERGPLAMASKFSWLAQCTDKAREISEGWTAVTRRMARAQHDLHIPEALSQGLLTAFQGKSKSLIGFETV